MKTLRTILTSILLCTALSIPVLADEIDMPSEPTTKTGSTFMIAALLVLMCVAAAIILIRKLKPKK